MKSRAADGKYPPRMAYQVTGWMGRSRNIRRRSSSLPGRCR